MIIISLPIKLNTIVYKLSIVSIKLSYLNSGRGNILCRTSYEYE